MRHLIYSLSFDTSSNGCSIIVCPNCFSEIGVDDPTDYDVDCDCGMTLTAKFNKGGN